MKKEISEILLRGMKIAKREDFALIFMSELAKYYPKKYVSLALVAKQARLSSLFLKHIASELLEKGLIESREGISGGYRLKKDPKNIPVSEIVSAISEGVVAPSCAHGGSCRIKKSSCSCINLWDKVNQHLFDYLKNVSLVEFMKL